MIILLIILEILAILTCFVIYKKYGEESYFIEEIVIHIGVGISVFLVITFAVMIIIIPLALSGIHIDEKIQIYAEENKTIETRIDSLVEKYMSYESDMYKELKNDDAITLVSLYPDLKSDELVKKQIDTYTENNTKIKKLKEEKITISISKWWLYFGK